MAHYSEEEAMVQAKQTRAAIDALFGPTGEYPDGRVSENDEGEIAFGITEVGGRVFIDFGTPVRQLGMTKAEALELAKVLIARASGATADEPARR